MQLEEDVFGMAAWERHGSLMPDASWRRICDADAILFGAMGNHDYEALPPKELEVNQLLRMRKEFDLFVNLRPVKGRKSLSDVSSLKAEVANACDLVIVRELSSGVYFGEPRGIETLPDGTRRGFNTTAYTSREVERIARAAFELARTRKRRLCSVDKSNVLECGRVWRESVIAVSSDYPDVELSHMYADNCAMQLARAPGQFDVIVTENLFGDLLSDVAAVAAGSLGLLPSASLSGLGQGPGQRAVYEPIHGSAPDIAGKGLANPIGAILSFALCLEHSFCRPADAALLDAAVTHALDSGARTGDLLRNGSRPIGTREMGDRILQSLEVLQTQFAATPMERVA
jgi:3-isopropylmalate dehydrogenase